MRIGNYLDEVMRKKGMRRDKELAAWLEVTPASICNYRNGTRSIDNEMCLKIALELEIDPMTVIMAADMDRAERSGQRSLWEVFSMKGATAKLASNMMAGFVAVNLFLTPNPEKANSPYENAQVEKASISPAINYAKLKHIHLIGEYFNNW